jgi:hypothetical protein
VKCTLAHMLLQEEIVTDSKSVYASTTSSLDRMTVHVWHMDSHHWTITWYITSDNRCIKITTNFTLNFYFLYIYCVYNEAAKTMSLFIIIEASSILRYKTGSPMIRAAFRTSLSVSWSLCIQRTMIPSCTSVKSVILLKGWKKEYSKYAFTNEIPVY